MIFFIIIKSDLIEKTIWQHMSVATFYKKFFIYSIISIFIIMHVTNNNKLKPDFIILSQL